MSNGETQSTPPPLRDVVVDAIVFVDWFVPEDHSADALRLLEKLTIGQGRPYLT
jgi:predicted nucleic acid-binding protein